MATKVQSQPIQPGNLPEDQGIENLVSQAAGFNSFLSLRVWLDVLEYLGDLLLRNVTVPEFVAGISIGLVKEIQRSRERVEFQRRSQGEKIIIFSDFVPQLAKFLSEKRTSSALKDECP